MLDFHLSGFDKFFTSASQTCDILEARRKANTQLFIKFL